MTPRDVEMSEPEPIHPLQTQFEDAEDALSMLSSSASPDAAIQSFQTLISYGSNGFTGIFPPPRQYLTVWFLCMATDGDDAMLETVQRVKEHSIYKLAQLYIQFGREKELATLLQALRPFFATLARAKTGKIGTNRLHGLGGFFRDRCK